MSWQIQVRRKWDGREWEPISVERVTQVNGGHERQYHYESLDEAKSVFADYVYIEGSLPNLIIRQATGREKLTDKYDVRFVWISEPGIIWVRTPVEVPKLEPDALSDSSADQRQDAANKKENA